MSNTISQLFRGQIEPIKFIGVGNCEMRTTENLIKNNLEKLKKQLNENETEILEKYSSLIDEYTFLISEQAFYDGFCLGMRISAEAVGGAERLL